jgi:hypothetical protein
VPRLCMNRAPDRETGEGAMTKVLIKYCPTVLNSARDRDRNTVEACRNEM